MTGSVHLRRISNSADQCRMNLSQPLNWVLPDLVGSRHLPSIRLVRWSSSCNQVPGGTQAVGIHPRSQTVILGV